MRSLRCSGAGVIILLGYLHLVVANICFSHDSLLDLFVSYARVCCMC
jgi:hypothetical protein